MLRDFDNELTQAGVASSFQVVRLLLDFHSNITRVDLRFVATPRQRILVEVTREQFDIKVLYLLGKFEIPERNWFKNFPLLKLLVLQRVFFPTGIPIFNDLRHITRIYSDKTEISGFNLILGDDFISGLPKLDFLYFRTQNTGIITVGSANVFNQLSALTSLNFYRISFSSVSPNVLKPLVNLKSFVVIFGLISDTAFLQQSELRNIEQINLAFNNLYSIEVFGNYPKLTKLALFNNEVFDLVRSDFTGLRALKSLDLHSNRVRNMNDDVFYELRDIKTMNLISNQISTVSSRQFEHLQSLSAVDLSGNSLICDCSFKWISEVSSKYGVNFEGECIGGDNNGKLITDPTNYVNCVERLALGCFNRSNICRENSRCVSYGATFLCPCIGGYEEINGECVDIDECVRGIADCEKLCSNLPGTYECCSVGYKQGSDGYCVELDECLDPRDNMCDQECLNTDGSYTCECNRGYNLSTDGLRCVDIDECAQSNNACKYKCKNELGSYHCECPNGYKVDTDGTTCYDGNNCTYNHVDCQRHCKGINGEFVCVCDEGYIHKEVNGTQSCVNIDECENPQICGQGCEDTIGSYRCLCDAGSRLAKDDHTCVDIDECSEETHDCNVLEICVNVEDSFDCICKFDHFIEGTSQCGFLPIYGYYAVGGGALAFVIPVVIISCILCWFVIYKRRRLTKEKIRLNKMIYKEVSLLRTTRVHTAYDPINNLQQAIDDDSRPSTAAGYERMTGQYVDNVYDSIDQPNSSGEVVNSGTQLIKQFENDS